MQSLTLTKTLLTKPAKSNVLEALWIQPAAKNDTGIGNLDEALRALTDAEHTIRTQAEHIKQLESLAMTDELTGLLNRRGLIMALHRELALARRDNHAEGVMIMVDLDGFKAINDMWGHSVGDDYLQAVAHTLLGCVRTSDVVARLGGDEFAILFPCMDEEAGMKRLMKLEKGFNSRLMHFGDKTLPLRASFGLSPYRGIDTPEMILANADLKLYAHKASRKKVK